jgi:ribose transport system substrate-binding protein
MALPLLAVLMAWGCGEAPPEEGGGTQGAGGAAAKPVYFVGFDASPPLVEALQTGQIQGLVIQDPFKMGRLGVKTLVDHLEGKPVEKNVSTGELLATPKNITDAEVAARLEPPKVSHSEDSGFGGTKQKTYRLMVIPKGTTHDHWHAVHAGAQKAAEELGNVEIAWLGPTKEDDRAAQIALVEKAIAAKVDGIVLAPLDSQALVRPVEDAVAAGIAVVIFDSDLATDKRVSFIATNNYNGGVLAAERLGSLLKGEGKIILLRYAPNSDATEQREKGFTDTIAKKFPKITFLSDNQYAGATADSAQQVSERLIHQFKGQVDGIFCPNESSTAGMLRALKDAGMLAGGK